MQWIIEELGKMAVDMFSCIVILLMCVVCYSNGELEFSTEPVQRTVLAGADITLPCIVNDFQPERHVVLWYRSGLLISNNTKVLSQDSGRITVSADPTIGQYNLHINNVEPSDDHMYGCSVSDVERDGEELLTSDPIRLEVESTPSSEYPRCSPLEKGDYVEGEEVTITCMSERANPPVALQWYQGSNKMENTLTDSQGFRTATQTFQVASTHNGDIFQCKMTTPAIAKYEKSCTVGPLSVLYKPRVSLVTSVNLYRDGDRVQLTCDAHANPDPYEYRWGIPDVLSERDDVVFAQNERVISFTASKELNGSEISCNATNRYGYGVSNSISLLVTSQNSSIVKEGPSKVPQDPNRNNVDAEALSPESEASASPPRLNNFLLLLIIGMLCTLIISLSLVLIWLMRRNHLRSTNTSRVVYNGPYAVCNGNTIERAWDHNSIYYEPQDQISVVYDPMWQSLPNPPRQGGRQQRNVAVQVPFREEDPHYAQIECDWDDDHGTLEL
ncbi:cell adhesion molecule 4-like [Apostichopus japonicus]|uniref:cell adhesion molecule 4-like n=1 Tax=Stichopus japonicus TaxID=307972 RepID=UPI003AB60EE1